MSVGPFTLPANEGHTSTQIFDPVPTAKEADFASLERLVVISLFSDARAEPDDALPVAGDSVRGFWAVEGGDNFGSKLWLLERVKNTAQNRAKAIDYANEALQWMVTDGFVEAVDVELKEQTNQERAALVVTITRGDETVLRFPSLWEAVANAT